MAENPESLIYGLRMVVINGTVADGFGKVADAFAQNFADFPELGAGFALVADGELKVDISAGVADKASGRPWDADTLQLVFSTTKGAAAICVARLVEAGKLSYSDTVATHWPEFAANGKGEVTVAQMMSHQAGLPYVDAPLTIDQILEVGPVVEALAAQTPIWEPGTAHGYHAVTYGWLAGELVRRVDGRSIGTYFADEVAGPLGLDFWIGLPESEEPRVSTLEASAPPSDPAELALMLQVMGPGTIGFKALTMNGSLMAFGAENPFNTRALHATEMPAANGITNASSLARMYAATVGEVDGVRLVGADTMRAMSTEAVNGPDEALVAETRFGMGFMLNNELVPLLSPTSFGHAGAGGSLGQADPESGVGYGYVMNQMMSGIAGDPRTVRLNDAVRACL
ncbi:serine hydrolase domain-containing protein [Ilumatobacter coccineus]|uniref:Putative esterase n=1 Tax=Ilumatobacter coccineus (strain NBRC 103263 / KCTC 29153 / YM16-304) TaxID=1313172 RepID=A0A6C7E929_ILUCY|nr:serine hydrolase domain-containing protein [Ilumatobacter coccineus]BAN02971.1 putative esterase [Ilumatobacter coccineus YM16-304]